VIDLYRVFPWDPGAALADPGGALFVPESAEGRISNPDLYQEFYAAGSETAAIAERLGRFVRWRRGTFVPRNGLQLALAHLYLNADARICELDDTKTLLGCGIQRPSDVVTTQRSITQAWARRIFEANRYDGISWWSRYNDRYRVYGIWNYSVISLAEAPAELTIEHPLVQQTAREIVRQCDRR